MDAGLRRARLGLTAALAVPLLTGCYYAHLVGGQRELLARREPVAKLLADPATDPALRLRLEHAQDARRYASRELGLPDNGSYTLYADLGRPYAVVNVFAASEFSLEPHTWCYVIGCFAYRGYYDVELARAEARELQDEGLDVSLGVVPAYSTLGWFDDPLLNTMGTDDDVIAGTLFHELAHQLRFVRSDTAFNESFATFVEQEGLRRYLKKFPERARAVAERQQRREQFVGLMLGLRQRLETLYASGLPPAEMRARKQAEFERLRQDYAALKQGWGGDGREDYWFEGDLNNARLLTFGLYYEWVPAFAKLFGEAGQDWKAFYARVDELADLDADQRRRRLEQLRGQI